MIRLSGMDYMNIFGYTGRLGFKNSNLGKTNTHYSNYGIGLSKRNTNSTYSTALTNSQKTLSTVGNEASALVKSANKLAGDVSYKNVEAFVENYNDTVAALSKTVNLQQQVYTGSVYGRNALNYNLNNLSILSALGYNSFDAFF